MIQVCGLLLSFLGYFLLMYILFRGRMTALYGAIWAFSIITLGAVSGLVGTMRMVFDFVYIAGLLLIPLSIIHLHRRRKEIPPFSFAVLYPFLFFSIGSCILYFLLSNRFLYAYDDFTHWGRIARILSTDFRFPLDSDLLSHGSYPPGSALFIAYVSNVVGNTQGGFFFAQAQMLLAFFLSLLCASEKTIRQLILSVFIVLFMSYNIALDALNVDNLLAAAFTACIALCLTSKNNPSSALFPLTIFLCGIVLLKNSGLLFFFFIIVFYLYLYLTRQRRFSVKLLLLLLPLILIALWHLYVNNTLTEVSSHQISVTHYQSVLADKTPEDLATIWHLFTAIMLDPSRNHILFLIPGYVIALITLKLQGTLKGKKFIFVYAVVFFIAYEIGLLLMYIFSMPMSEILFQNGRDYDRYNNTMTLILAYTMLFLTASFQYTWKPAAQKLKTLLKTLVTCIAAAAIFLNAYQVVQLNLHSFRSTQARVSANPNAYALYQMEEELLAIPSLQSHIVLLDQEDTSGYNRYLIRYYLRSKDVVYAYSQEEGRTLCLSDPWRYYIDPGKGTVLPPAETVFTQLFTRDPSTHYTNVLNQVGFQENTRYSISAAEDLIAYYWDITGYIPAKVGDTIYLKNVQWYPSTEDKAQGGIFWFREDLSYRSNDDNYLTPEDLEAWNPVFDERGSIIQITVPDKFGSTTRYLRIICQDINTASIITVNEEIH